MLEGIPAGAVGCTVARAVRLLQACVGTEPDGSIGPATLGAVAGKLPQDLIRTYCDQRLDFLKRLPTWDTFGKGWEHRVKEVEQTALSMCK